jgi:tetratricopeptide (TPR) repeat protein
MCNRTRFCLLMQVSAMLIGSTALLSLPAIAAAPAVSGDAEWHYMQAIKLEDTAQPEAALKEYQRALEILPESDMCLLGEARCYSAMGLHARAIALLDNLSKSRSTAVQVWLNLAVVSLAAGEVQHAAQAIEQALRVDPNSAAATRILAEISFRNGQFSTAAALSARVLDLDPNNRDGYILLARCCRKLKSPPEDLDGIAEAAKENLPKDAALFVYLGKDARGSASALSKGRTESMPEREAWQALAQKCFTYAVDAAPRDIQSRIELIKMMKRNHEFIEAKQQLAAAQKLDPNNEQVIALSEAFKPSSNDLAGRLKYWLHEVCRTDGNRVAAQTKN